MIELYSYTYVYVISIIALSLNINHDSREVSLSKDTYRKVFKDLVSQRDKA